MHADWLGWFSPWWPDMAAFFSMGRHGAYVWACVAITAAAIAVERMTLSAAERRHAQDASATPFPDAPPTPAP